MNENLLSGLNLSCIAKTLQCGECLYRGGGSVLKRSVGRFQRQSVFRNRCILGKTPRPCPEHLIPWLKLRDVGANGFHPPGDVSAESRVFRFEKPTRDDTGQKRTSHSQVKCIDGCRMNLYQDFTVPGNRFLYLFELKNIR